MGKEIPHDLVGVSALNFIAEPDVPARFFVFTFDRVEHDTGLSLRIKIGVGNDLTLVERLLLAIRFWDLVMSPPTLDQLWYRRVILIAVVGQYLILHAMEMDDGSASFNIWI